MRTSFPWPGYLLPRALLSLLKAMRAGLDGAFVALTGRSPDNRD
jgi:hypothetical protein